jgi:hypothetical protein
MNLHRSHAVPATPVSAVTFVSQPASCFDQGSFFRDQTQAETRWQQNSTRLATSLRLFLVDLHQSNVGLLLIAASQLFNTLMNVAVKFLNDLDDPVPTLEVRTPDDCVLYRCSPTAELSMGSLFLFAW